MGICWYFFPFGNFQGTSEGSRAPPATSPGVSRGFFCPPGSIAQMDPFTGELIYVSPMACTRLGIVSLGFRFPWVFFKWKLEKKHIQRNSPTNILYITYTRLYHKGPGYGSLQVEIVLARGEFGDFSLKKGTQILHMIPLHHCDLMILPSQWTCAFLEGHESRGPTHRMKEAQVEQIQPNKINRSTTGKSIFAN